MGCAGKAGPRLIARKDNWRSALVCPGSPVLGFACCAAVGEFLA